VLAITPLMLSCFNASEGKFVISQVNKNHFFQGELDLAEPIFVLKCAPAKEELLG